MSLFSNLSMWTMSFILKILSMSSINFYPICQFHLCDHVFVKLDNLVKPQWNDNCHFFIYILANIHHYLKVTQIFLYCGVFVWSSIHSSIERLEEWFYPLWQIQINDICNKKCSMFSKIGISAHNAPCIENLYNSIVDEPQLKYQGFHQVITSLINHPTPLTYYICN